eukprot:1394920-Rhodomonas_salina.1
MAGGARATNDRRGDRRRARRRFKAELEGEDTLGSPPGVWQCGSANAGITTAKARRSPGPALQSWN